MPKGEHSESDSEGETSLSDMKAQRGVVRGQMTKLKNYMDTKGSEANQFELVTKLGLLETYLANFNIIQTRIETIEMVESNDREVFEDSYFNLKSKLLELINKRAPRLSLTDTTIGASVSPGNRNHRSNLPKLKLPTFSGIATEWLDFIGMFETLINEDQSLTEVEKFQHLRNCLSPLAYTSIKAFENVPQNYRNAMAHLKSRYGNKRYIFQAHINNIFQSKPITKCTVDNLRHQNDIISSNMRALLTISNKEQITDGLLLHLIIPKLDSTTQSKWEEEVSTLALASNQRAANLAPNDNSAFVPTWEQFSTFLERRCQILEFVEANRTNAPSFDPSLTRSKFQSTNTSPRRSAFVTTKDKSPNCVICSQSDHSPFQCRKFSSLSQSERFNEAKRLHLCINCLKPGHSVKLCKSRKCQICSRNHHTMLHIGTQQLFSTPPGGINQLTTNISNPTTSTYPSLVNTPNSVPIIQNSNTSNSLVTSIANFAHESAPQRQGHIILATALVNVKDINGSYLTCRALLDSASQVNFISERIMQRLGIKRYKADNSIGGIGNLSTRAKFSTSITIVSMHNDYTANLEALILPKIIGDQPDFPINKSQIVIPPNIKLADPAYYQPQGIDLLIGASIFFELLSIGQIRLGANLPTLQKTTLGWILSGPIPEQKQYSLSAVACNSSQENEFTHIETLLSKFWEIENPVITSPTYTAEELICEKHFAKTTTRNSEGRYVVRLPFREDPSNLGESFNIALKRFHNLEQKLYRSEELRKEYSRFILEYIHLKHMEKIEINNLTPPRYFLPHHCVIKPDNTSTKLRVVFDGSCKDSSGKSLNDLLMTGPTIQGDLFSITFRFRMHLFVLTADIVKMYRQVLVDPRDRNLQCILWRNTSDEQVDIYRLNTVTYGTASAAYLAIRSLVQLANDEAKCYNVGSKVILDDFYVDNMMTGANTIEEAIIIKKQVASLLCKGGFHLKKWCSNNPIIISDIPPDDREALLHINNDNIVKTLGLYWNPASDYFSFYYCSLKGQNLVTKREILSEVARFFDPLGLINPIIVSAKIFLQQLWKLKLHWDESLPQILSTQWEEFKRDFPIINNFKFPRYVTQPNSVIQIHGFCDASELAYGAAIYIRSTNPKGTVKTQLLCAKSKVAPLNKVTLPKLELCAAVVLAELITKIQPLLNVSKDQIFCWSDSTITLAWINTESCELLTFVANRVSKIQQMTESGMWRHISSQLNPADIVSRGSNPKNLLQSELWFRGPAFLKIPEDQWPHFSLNPNINVPERKKTQFSLASTIITDITFNSKFSNSYYRQLLVFAYILRFIHNINKKNTTKLHGFFTPCEMDNSLRSIIRNIQIVHLSNDYSRLSSGKAIKIDSRLKNLTPFLDKEGIIRVGGRLINSDLPVDAKHQMILPSKHPFTESLIVYYHIKNLHSGCQSLQNIIRSRIWILGAKNAIKGVIRKCILCFRSRPTISQQIMGQYPSDRISPSRPFTVTGVDFCGPFAMSLGIRGKRPVKVYVSIFVCFSTKAVHIELVHDLSTHAFLLALKRFISRRGNCRKLYSDNATNFVGCCNRLTELQQLFSSQNHSELVKAMCLQDNIEWSFIPPRTPHFGGLWESAVKVAKRHMMKVIGNTTLSTFELMTLMCQIEAIMNSRPIIPMSGDPNDTEALTPSHILIGSEINSFPEPLQDNLNLSQVNRYQRLQSLRQQFWDRWKNEYLNTLQSRSKWQIADTNLQVGDLVLLKEDNSPPLKWPLGRIITTHEGDDNRVRVITVKTKTGTYKRGITKICRLPIH